MMVLLEKHFYIALFIPIKIHVIPATAAGQIGVRAEVLCDSDQSFVRCFGKGCELRSHVQGSGDTQDLCQPFHNEDIQRGEIFPNGGKYLLDNGGKVVPVRGLPVIGDDGLPLFMLPAVRLLITTSLIRCGNL